MKILAPSYKRADGVKTHKIIPDVIYCVAQFEAEEYTRRGYNVYVMPDEVQGNISRVRNWMLDTHIQDGKGLIVDDDIEAFKTWSWKDGRCRPVKIKDIHEFIEHGFNLAEQFGVRLWGLNILGDKGSYREYTPFSLNNPLSAAFMGFLNNPLRFDERIPLKEDYDYSINNAHVFRKLLRINYAYMVKKDHGNKGGCADYRTLTREKEQLDILQRKWGSRIVRTDTTQRGKKIKGYDINPIIRIPIAGI